MRYKKNEPPEFTQKVYQYIKDNPGTSAGMIARALGAKHKNYIHQVIGSFELYDGLTVYEDNHRFWHFDKHELDNKGWIV